MRLRFPIGIKFKTYYEKMNVTSHLQSNIDKEIKEFYNIPLNEESFDSKIKEIQYDKSKSESKSESKTKKNKSESNPDSKKKSESKTKKIKIKK